MKKIPKTSTQVTAVDPSEEFSYTWVEPFNTNSYIGMFFRTEAEAKADAMENYHNFSISMKNREVWVIQVKNILKA